MTNTITLLIDGNNTIWRAHWKASKMVEPLVTSKGENTGCKYTFLNIIKSYVDQFNANNVFLLGTENS